MRIHNFRRRSLILLYFLWMLLLAVGNTGCDYLVEQGEEPGEVQGEEQTYVLPYDKEANYLLSRVGSWSLPSCRYCSDGRPPQVAVGNGCMRDTYVAAAALYAWAAASYAKTGLPDEATYARQTMMGELQKADQLCSNSPSFGGSSCKTLTIWPCGGGL